MSTPSSSEAIYDENELLPPSSKIPRLDGQKKYKNVYPTRVDSRSTKSTTTWTVKLSLPPAKQFRLGSLYTSPEAAARASDHALIAIYGLKAAAPFLNFPPSDYTTTTQQQQQLFGPPLTAYLQALGKAPNGQIPQSLTEDEGGGDGDGDDNDEEEQHQRDQEQEDDEDTNKKPCGMCPACRLPWATDIKCLQLTTKNSHSQDVLAKARQKSLANRSRKTKLKAKQISSIVPSNSSVPVVKWVGKPVKLTAATLAHKAALRMEQGKAEQQEHGQQTMVSAHLNASLVTEADAEAEAEEGIRKTTTNNNNNKNQIALMNKALHPSDIYPPLPYTTLIHRAEDGHFSNTELSLIPEDDPVRWVQPPTSKTQCPLCKGFHSSGTAGIGSRCPVLEAAYAVVVPSNKHQCKYCVCYKVPGCSKCRGKVATLPGHLTFPLEMRIRWGNSGGGGGGDDRQERGEGEREGDEEGKGVIDVRPCTLEVMDAVKQVANAAVVDLNAPHLAGKLSPDALLAVGLIAESLGKKLVGNKKVD
jgi:hypothetical protein